MEVIILGANTLYSVFCFFKALLPKQVWSGMVGKGLSAFFYLHINVLTFCMLDQFCNVFSYDETVLLATVLRMLALHFPLSPLLLYAWHHKGHMTQCEAIHQTCEVLCANTDTKPVLSMDY